MRVVPSSLLTAPPKTRTVSPHLVAGKAPWQTVRCACRLARRACRSSSQKVLRYFLGARYARASFPLGGKLAAKPPEEGRSLRVIARRVCGARQKEGARSPTASRRRVRLFLNQVKVIRTRPERRLLRVLGLILIAIPLWVLLLRRPNPSQNALFQGAKQSQAGRSLYCKGEIRTRSKAASSVETLACALLACAARFAF